MPEAWRCASTATVAALLVAACAGAAAQQQPYPGRPIGVVAPFGAGGLVDVLSRAVGEKLRPALGQQIVVDNRPGAGGNIGAEIAAEAESDGFPLLMIESRKPN